MSEKKKYKIVAEIETQEYRGNHESGVKKLCHCSYAFRDITSLLKQDLMSVVRGGIKEDFSIQELFNWQDLNNGEPLEDGELVAYAPDIDFTKIGNIVAIVNAPCDEAGNGPLVDCIDYDDLANNFEIKNYHLCKIFICEKV